MSFTHLHVHTEHSFLDGVSTLDGLCDRVVELKQSAVAITDHGEVSGHLLFQKAAKKRNITPIFGMEGYFVDDAANKQVAYDYDHITLLAVNQVGLSNLWMISTKAYSEGMYHKPRLDWKMLTEHGEGIVATGGCIGGVISKYLIEGEDRYNPGYAEERLGRFMDVLDGRFYLEAHTLPDPKQHQVNKALTQMSGTFGVPMIAVSDSHYLYPQDWEMHELLIAAQMNKKYNDPTRYTYGYKQGEGGWGKDGYGALHVLSEKEVRQRLNHLPPEVVDQAIANTSTIAEMAEGVQVKGNRSYPIFLTKIEEDQELLKRDAWRLFDEKASKLRLNEEQTEQYKERLRRELDLVITKGYAGYFLITAEVVQWAKKNGILAGPGRGSAAGSLLSYVLGITEIDPVAHSLLFERFMDPNLKSLPDIDIDVPQNKRAEVLKHLRGKYEVSGIGTLMTLRPKILLNDFCRLLNIGYVENQAIGRIIDSTIGRDTEMTWPQVADYAKVELAPYRKKYGKLFELMDAFAAHYRQAGVHAAGVVVSRKPLMGHIPMRIKNKEDTDLRTQMPMQDVEELGFMKMDFLGLRTLSTLENALEMARENWDGTKPKPIHFHEWQYSDYYDEEAPYKALWDGRNLGIFQIETEAGSDITKRYMPLNLEDMCAVVALNRPGLTRNIDPATGLSMLELFLQKREGKREVTFHHPILKPILGHTFGAFLYQEQIMQVVRDVGNFSPEDQSKVRKALGKKLGLEEYKDRFIASATEKEIDQEVAETIWHDMEKFGEYGFNKSHGFAYGMIAHWTAWMKYHYPEEFMTALFQTNDAEKKAYNRECGRLKIPLLGPDVNESKANFALVNGRIRYGFLGTKFVGDKGGEAVMKHRPYSSATNVMDKLDHTRANKRAIESLILIGALDAVVTEQDCEGLPSGWSATKVALYRLFRKKLVIGPRKDAGLDEAGIFRKYLPEFQAYADSLDVDNLSEHEVTYLDEHVTTEPFAKHLASIKEHYQFRGYDSMSVGEHGVLGGKIADFKETKVKKEGPSKDRPMGFVHLEYPVIEDDAVVNTETRKLVCFPKEWTYLAEKVEVGVPVIVKIEKLADSGGYEGGLALQSIYRIDKNEYPGMHSLSRVPVEDDPTQAEGYFD